MRPLTESDVREAFVNVTADDLRIMAMPHDFLLTEWDHLDFFAWRDPRVRERGYLVVEHDGRPVAVMLRAANGSPSRARAALCNICHTMQPADQVSLFTARCAGEAGAAGDSVGSYMCADLDCHESVRLAAPLAPSEIRAEGQVDARIDGTRHRAEAFVGKVLAVRVSSRGSG